LPRRWLPLPPGRGPCPPVVKHLGKRTAGPPVAQQTLVFTE
jgi:hypothetical protein